MGICDKSMSLLTGSQMSVGTFRGIIDLVREKGPAYMPGYCVSFTFVRHSFHCATTCISNNLSYQHSAWMVRRIQSSSDTMYVSHYHIGSLYGLLLHIELTIDFSFLSLTQS